MASVLAALSTNRELTTYSNQCALELIEYVPLTKTRLIITPVTRVHSFRDGACMACMLLISELLQPGPQA